MAKRVVLIVSGEADRVALPHLCRELRQATETFEVRKPPGNALLTPEQAKKLIKSAWYDLSVRGTAPDKFVVLVDADAHEAAEAAAPFEEMVSRLLDVAPPKLVAVAVRHLEAWFFAHSEKLRDFLRRSLGSVDTSQPDKILNPKRQLIHLLESRMYTSRVAEQIASQVDPQIVMGRSPSFAALLGKLKNGPPSLEVRSNRLFLES